MVGKVFQYTINFDSFAAHFPDPDDPAGNHTHYHPDAPQNLEQQNFLNNGPEADKVIEYYLETNANQVNYVSTVLKFGPETINEPDDDLEKLDFLNNGQAADEAIAAFLYETGLTLEQPKIQKTQIVTPSNIDTMAMTFKSNANHNPKFALKRGQWQLPEIRAQR